MKTMILTHADCDGICAGAVALARFPGAGVFFTKPVSVCDDLRNTEAERIIIADIAVNKTEQQRFMQTVEGNRAKIMYFDHHPLQKETEKRLPGMLEIFVHDEKSSASELVYRHFQKELPKEMIWPALYGAIGDYAEDTDFVRKNITNWDKRAINFEVCTISLGTKNDEFSSYDAKRNIVRTLAEGRNPSDIEGLVKSAKEAVKREFDLYRIVKRRAKTLGKIGYITNTPSFGFRGPAALFAATATGKPVGICMYKRERYLDVTIRAREPGIALNKLAEAASESVKGSGGGHENAAGAKIPFGTFEQFLKKMNEMIK
ncbi:MAG: DHHA1 domain-containing protein [Candidatus Aenigmarchaeota archaeon]|nr:DHHA1 domain-containing protein [Candidatus Aenigmarchaeota archaeon]